MIPTLLDEGWTIKFRSHPYHHHDVEDFIGKNFEGYDQVGWEVSPTIEQALQSFDVVVSNITTAYYQSLYAGWPTIFYEPNYRQSCGIEAIESGSYFYRSSDVKGYCTTDH